MRREKRSAVAKERIVGRAVSGSIADFDQEHELVDDLLLKWKWMAGERNVGGNRKLLLYVECRQR